MHEKAEPEREPAGPIPAEAPVARAALEPLDATTPGGVQALQRTAGNQAVARWLGARATLARDGAPTAAPTAGAPTATPVLPREDHVFLMGDPAADEFYREARGFYAQKYGKATIRQVGSLAEILTAVKAAKAPIGHLVIVSHAHEDGTLMFKLDANDPDNRLEFGELKKANDDGKMPEVDQKIVDDQTSIEIRGCNIGRSPLMLNQLDKAFGGKAKVSAPTHEQHYAHDKRARTPRTSRATSSRSPGSRRRTTRSSRSCSRPSTRSSTPRSGRSSSAPRRRRSTRIARGRTGRPC